jgi:hypothetical protein
LFLLPLLAALGSCAAVAVAAVAGVAAYGVVSYSKNEASMDYHGNLDVVFAATLAAMHEQGFAVNREQKPGATEGRIESGDATVWVERHEGSFTRVRVRIGTFDTDDHRRRSRLLLERIRKELEE